MVVNPPRGTASARYFALQRVMRYPNGHTHRFVVVRGQEQLSELIELARAGETLHQLTPEMVRSSKVTMSAVEGQLERGEFEQL